MNRVQILHIARDEKFIAAAHYLFEKAFPDSNRFVIVKPPADPPLRFIDKNFEARIIVQSPSTVSELLEISRNADVVVLHGLDPLKGAVFLASPKKNKFVSIIFGGELYNSTVQGRDYLGPKSRKLEHKLQRGSILHVLKEVYRSIRYKDTRGLYDEITMEEVFQKMPYFGFTSRSTHERYLREGILNSESRLIPFSYYPLEFMIGLRELSVSGTDILLGNSASLTNNHLEALDLLSGLNLNGTRIAAPLSYGREDYADIVEQYGHRKLRNFNAIREFLPLDQYHELISRCGYVVMNHYRSQAMGNIIASLYIGARVFLNRTDAYIFFKELGCHIYLVDEHLKKQGRKCLVPLDEEQIQHNRRMLRKVLSTDALVENLRCSIGQIQ